VVESAKAVSMVLAKIMVSNWHVGGNRGLRAPKITPVASSLGIDSRGAQQGFVRYNSILLSPPRAGTSLGSLSERSGAVFPFVKPVTAPANSSWGQRFCK
jgi:hypothetical protein